MSTTKIPIKIITALWVHAGGRCEYQGCNAALWRDELTLAQMNRAYVAHIIADEPRGPRGDPKLSRELAKELSNLMLMCDVHHRLIDKVEVAEHPVSRLREMKGEHEERIETLTAIQRHHRTQLVLLQANIGTNKDAVAADDARRAVLPERYPLHDVFTINLTGTALVEGDEGVFEAAANDIVRQVQNRIVWRNGLASEHLSVFALGPMPLLMAFGRALGDKTAADVYQRHRDTESWGWPAGTHAPLALHLVEPPAAMNGARHIAIELSVSSTIPETAIQAALGKKRFAAYSLRAPLRSTTLVRARDDVRAFGQQFQSLMETIRRRHGERCTLHLFPALPVSLAVQLGRVLLPKVHPPIVIYDFDAKGSGFSRALTL